MALILKYRLDPPDSVSQEVYAALVKQVGQTGLNVQCPINEEGDVTVTLTGQFISVEGEHFEERSGGGRVDDRTPEELASGPSSREADRAASQGEF